MTITLPAHLFNSYRRYKEDTGKLLSWLRSISTSLAESLPTPNTEKGSISRSTSKNSQKPLPPNGRGNVLTIAEFTELVQRISKSFDLGRIPDNVYKLLDRIIQKRVEVSSFFLKLSKETPSAALAEQNKGHLHFISILQNAFNVLGGEEWIKKLREKQTILSEGGQSASSFEFEHANHFEALSLYDWDDMEQGSTKPIQPVGSEGSNSNKEADTLSSEADVHLETAFDALYASWCLFEDASLIRKYVKTVWRSYKARQTSLLAASYITTIATDTVRQIETELRSEFPQFTSYEAIVRDFLPPILTKKGGFSKSWEDYTDWTMWSTHLWINSFGGVIENGFAPFCKPGFFGYYDPKLDRHSMTIEAKIEEDQCILLSMFLPDTLLLARLSQQSEYPGNAVIVKDLRSFGNSRDKQPSVSIVFSVQLYLDHLHELRLNSRRGLIELRLFGTKILKEADLFFQSKFNYGPCWEAKDDEVVRGMQADCKLLIQDDPLYQWKIRNILSAYPDSSVEPDSYLKMHPWMCGWLTYRLLDWWSHAGVQLVNGTGFVVAVVHFYNTLQAMGLLEQKWEAMEMILGVYGNQIFTGKRRTESTGQMEFLRGFMLVLGLKADTFAKGRRMTRNESFLKHNAQGRGIESKVSLILDIAKNPHTEAASCTVTKEQMHKVIEVSSPTSSSTSSARRMRKHLDNVEFLSALNDLFSHEIASHKLGINLFALQRVCVDYLENLDSTLKKDFVKLFGRDYIEEKWQLPFIVGYLLLLMEGNEGDEGTDLVTKAADLLNAKISSVHKKDFLLF